MWYTPFRSPPALPGRKCQALGKPGHNQRGFQGEKGKKIHLWICGVLHAIDEKQTGTISPGMLKADEEAV